jgi:hypothetical protein
MRNTTGRLLAPCMAVGSITCMLLRQTYSSRSRTRAAGRENAFQYNVCNCRWRADNRPEARCSRGIRRPLLLPCMPQRTSSAGQEVRPNSSQPQPRVLQVPGGKQRILCDWTQASPCPASMLTSSFPMLHHPHHHSHAVPDSEASAMHAVAGIKTITCNHA